jgi:hypothetical protein
MIIQYNKMEAYSFIRQMTAQNIKRKHGLFAAKRLSLGEKSGVNTSLVLN